MINKKKFKNELSITQGRHLKIINKRIQIFPEKIWKNELKLFKLTKLNFIEWVISKDNYLKNPMCKKKGYKIINKYLKKNKIKCRSVDLDFIVNDNPLKFSNNRMKAFLEGIKIVSSNALKIGVKYLIFPFLENSSPNGTLKQKKLISILNEVRKKTPHKIHILIETDLKPEKLLSIIKKMKNRIFINYDTGNSAAKNFDFNQEKKYFRYVKNIHLKDRIKYGSTIRFGHGNANFKKIFTFLMKNKYKYDFNLQPARARFNEDIKEIRLNIDYIDNLLTKL